MRNIYVFEESFNEDKIERKPKRALLMTPSEWNKFGSHLSKEQKLLEAAEQRRAEDERKQQLSKEMAKTWDNTVLNFRRRRLELRREKLDKIESDRKKRFLQTRKEEEDLKEKIISDAKEILRHDKDGIKSLNSCFRFAEVLRERAEQIKFESKLKAIEADREAKYEQTVLLDVKKFEEEVKEKEAKKIEKKKKLTAEAQEEFRQYFEKKKQETEERLKLEREDNINIIREIEMEKENARKDAERKKNIILDDVAQNRKMIEEYLEQKRYEEEEEENAIKIHAAAKKKLAVIRKKKEIQMRLEAQQRRDKLSLRLATEEADRNAKEQAILQKAVAEREVLEEEDKKNKKAYQERLLNELLEERKRFLEKEEEQRIKDAEKAKWELMQRLKLTEENQKFVLSKKLEAINKQQENRKNWDVQRAEEKAVEAEQREQDINAVRRAGQWWEDEDKEFLSYAESLLEDSRKKGRPLLPMMRYIEEYKKQHNLVKPRSQHKTWKSNVPIDSSSKEPPQITVPKTVRPAPTKPIDNSPILKHEDESKTRPSIQTTKKPVEKWPNCTETECKRVIKDKNGLPKE